MLEQLENLVLTQKGLLRSLDSRFLLYAEVIRFFPDSLKSQMTSKKAGKKKKKKFGKTNLNQVSQTLEDNKSDKSDS